MVSPTRRRTYHLVGGKGQRGACVRLSRPAAALAWVYVALVLLIAVGVPYFSIISTSLIKLRGYGLAAGNFTLAHYVELFTKNSLTLAVSSASLCAVLGTLLAAAVHGKRSRAARAVEAAGMLPEMLPGIVLVIGVMLFWNRLYRFIPLYNTMGIMVAAYVALFLPYTIQYVSSAYTQISDSLTAAAQVFGGSPAYVFRRVTLPLLSRGVLSGWMMTFIIAFRELVTASLIAPPNVLVVSTYIVREFEQGSVSVGMAMAVLCVLLTTTALILLNLAINRRKGSI